MLRRLRIRSHALRVLYDQPRDDERHVRPNVRGERLRLRRDR